MVLANSPEFISQFTHESWALYASGTLVFLLRSCVQFYRHRRLLFDDYLMTFAWIWFTVLCVSLNKIVGGGGSNLMSAAEEAALTPSTISAHIEGAKWVFISEQALVLTVWSLKGCMLYIYFRITKGLKQRTYIVCLTVYTYIGLGVTEICIFTFCHPFKDYWAVPNPPGKEQCATYTNYLIVQGVFHITSDVGMLLVVIPLLLMVQIPLQQKLGVLVIFSMGICVIVAALLNKIYSCLPSLLNESVVYTSWYMREATVSMFVVCLPALWPITIVIFPGLRGKSDGDNALRNVNSLSGHNLKSYKFSALGNTASQEHIIESPDHKGRFRDQSLIKIRRDYGVVSEEGSLQVDDLYTSDNYASVP